MQEKNDRTPADKLKNRIFLNHQKVQQTLAVTWSKRLLDEFTTQITIINYQHDSYYSSYSNKP